MKHLVYYGKYMYVYTYMYVYISRLYQSPKRIYLHWLPLSWNSHFPQSMEVQWKEKKEEFQ